jgi:hypothetical protein
MSTKERVKIISAILLVTCLALPISSCSRYVDSNGKPIVKYDPKTHVNAKLVIKYNYPLERFNPKDIYNWLLLLCFIWPIPIILYRHKGTKKLIKNIIWSIEPLFALASSCYIWLKASLFAEPCIAAYLSISANGIYGIAWLSEMLTKIFHKYRKN